MLSSATRSACVVTADRPLPRRENARPLCLCGTPLAAVEGTNLAVFWRCTHCGRAFCHECGGMLARWGGCDVCTVCGAGQCG